MNLANGELGPQMAMEVYVMRADGTEPERLTNDTVPNFVGQQARAPDGQKLLMDSWQDGDSEILIVRPDGTTIRQLTDNDAWDGSAALVTGWAAHCVPLGPGWRGCSLSHALRW
jgi:hypothetical protein